MKLQQSFPRLTVPEGMLFTAVRWGDRGGTVYYQRGLEPQGKKKYYRKEIFMKNVKVKMTKISKIKSMFFYKKDKIW